VDDDVDALRNTGRFGGVMQATLAAGGVVLLALMVGHPGLSTPQGMAYFLAGFSVVALLGYSGMRSILRGRAAAEATRKAIDGAALRELVRTRELGFFVCTRCNTIGDRDWGNGCMRCGSMAEFLPVSDEDERKLAMAAVIVGE